MSFPFLPRSVKRRKFEATPTQDQVSASVPSISTPAGPRPESEGQSSENARVGLSSKGKENAQIVESRTRVDPPDHVNNGYDWEDLARIVWLSLSDYALWSDTDLRRKIDFATQEGVYNNGDARDLEEAGNNNGGYIPLSYLMKKSPVFLQAASTLSLAGLPEITYVKAIRAHASDLLEARLILADEGPSSFGPNRWSTKNSPTGYEVRRKPTGDRFREYGKADWHALTIYVENIPFPYRNICGVSRFISSLLKSSANSVSKVQHISFPPHHNDRPGTLPSCKGFALVTLSASQDVEFLLAQWPWDESLPQPTRDLKDGEEDAPREDAVKSGFRCLSKGRWEELRAEYLLYRQQLIAELEAENEAQEKIHRNQSTIPHGPHTNSYPSSQDLERCRHQSEKIKTEVPQQTKTQGAIFNLSSPFPPECLVFVRNVHPETNKTTLRALFSQAFKSEGETDSVDYVDYTKGLDSCYLRFSSPPHASSFVKHFTDNAVTQMSALDGDGKLVAVPSEAGSPLLTVTPELVTGKREEFYWQKVPEKIRRQAVEKAMNALSRSKGQGTGSAAIEGQGKKRRRGK